MKSKEVVFGDIKITVNELSFDSQLTLTELGDKKTLRDTYKYCLDDIEKLKLLSVEEGLLLAKEINIINGWGKASEDDGDDEDFPKPTNAEGGK